MGRPQLRFSDIRSTDNRVLFIMAGSTVKLPNPSTPSPRKRKSSAMQVIDLTSSPDPSPKKSPSKRKKTTDGEPTPSPEKRAKRQRDHPPQGVLVKRQRVMTQRMFLVERSGRKNGALQEEFSVLGSTGNVYIVNVSMIPT